MGSTGGVAAAVRLLEAGIAALAEVDLDGRSDGEQLALLRVVHPLVCRMEAQRSRVIGSVHRRGAVFADGAVSTVAWLRSRLRMSDGQAQVRAAAAAREVPELATAYAAGQVSHAQVSVVAAVVPDIAPEVLAAGAGKLLAEQATQLAPGPLRHAAIHIRDHFDPDAAQRRARQRLEERWLSVARTFDGAVAVQGLLDPDGGELLDLGRAARLVSTAQRRALTLRDQGCRFPGCDRPPQWTDAHHLIPWAHGGPTNLDKPRLTMQVASHRRPRRRLDPAPAHPHQHHHRNQTRRPTPRHHQPATKPLTRPGLAILVVRDAPEGADAGGPAELIRLAPLSGPGGRVLGDGRLPGDAPGHGPDRRHVTGELPPCGLSCGRIRGGEQGRGVDPAGWRGVLQQAVQVRPYRPRVAGHLVGQREVRRGLR